MKSWEIKDNTHYSEKYLLNKIKKLEEKIAYYENPCLICGPDGWSTYICENCAEEDE